MCPKRTFPSDFVKLGSEILYLFLAEKMVVCCMFCLFVATLSDFGFLFFKLKHSSSRADMRKMLLRKKLFDVQFGN